MADLTPTNREEYWLQGMVDGQTALEPNNRREFWYKEIMDAIGSGGGGGTGGGDAIVFTQTVSGGFPPTLEYSCNKTLSEAIQLVGTVPIYFKDSDGLLYSFIRVFAEDGEEAFLKAVFIDIYIDDGNIVMHQYQIDFDANGVTCTVTSN